MTRVCVFCGGTPLTKEHVFPRWLERVLPGQERWRGQDVAEVGGELLTESVLPVTHREMGQRFSETTVARVCQQCNGGWMNDLETATRPSLTPLILGELASFEREDAQRVAQWTVKTSLMGQLTHPESAALPLDGYRVLHEEGRPPPGMRVWALNSDAPDWALRFQHFGIWYGDRSTFDEADPCNTFSTTIGLGRVAFCVMGSANEALVLPALEEVPPLRAVRLWPDPHPFDWTTASPLEDQDLWIVSDLLRLWIGDDDDLFLRSLVQLGINHEGRRSRSRPFE